MEKTKKTKPLPIIVYRHINDVRLRKKIQQFETVTGIMATCSSSNQSLYLR